MTTKTWNGTSGDFYTAVGWTPVGAPQPGDVAIIDAGSVTATNAVLSGLTIQLDPSQSGSAVAFAGSTLSADSRLKAQGSSGLARVGVTGRLDNLGLISFVGPGTARFTTTLQNDQGGTAILRNGGAIAAVDASPNIVTTAAGQVLQNDGTIAVWNPSHGIQFAIVGAPVTGTGVVTVDAFARIEFVQAVGSGQIVQFLNGGAGQSSVQLDAPTAFAGTFTGFVASDSITLRSTPFTAYAWTQTSAAGGTLTLTNGAAAAASLNFTGAYQTSDFGVTFTDLGGGLSTTTISTTKAAPAQIFSMTDTVLGVSTTDAGETYTGPVDYLQHQFIWSSPDAVAISASAPNVFLKGGAAGDALAVSTGRNVLDGGGGSNFLVGGTGPDSLDTFFVDGRGGVNTWSSIVNFHQGDQATIFGFRPGVSTLPFTASDGAVGYTGLTIHSELAGAGTGVNGSITFAGVDQATADAHFSITSGTLLPGTADAIDYLLIQYNR